MSFVAAFGGFFDAEGDLGVCHATIIALGWKSP
jgi:hypothetical protein